MRTAAALLGAVLLLAAGCLIPGYARWDRSKIWEQPGLNQLLPGEGSRNGYSFYADRAEGDFPFDHAALEEKWGPLEASRVSWYPEGRPPLGGEVQVIELTKLMDPDPVVLMRVNFDTPMTKCRELFLEFVQRVMAADAPTTNRWVQELESTPRCGVAHVQGPFRLGALVSELERMQPAQTSPGGAVGTLGVQSGDWDFQLDTATKRLERKHQGELLRLTIDPADRCEFRRDGPSNLSDRELSERLDRAFQELGLGQPRLEDRTFWHGGAGD